MIARRLRPLLTFAAGLAVAGPAALPPTASAEEQPSILKAYGLDWIERVREDAWPQPKAQRPVICLLDTGVNITPDTPADDPNGPIVARLALDGGTGFAQGTEWQHLHGTDMASVIAAPRNGYGTVGVFPQARIVSIRVTEGAETYITPAAVRQGVRTCLQYGKDHALRVSAINVSETNYAQRTTDVSLWRTAGMTAESAGAVVVAAVGNDPDAATVAPLAVVGMVAVAAGDEAGDACAFVAGIPQPGALRAPGCARSRAWPVGSSAAAATVSALIGALTSLLPTSSPAQIRDLVARAAITREDGSAVLAAAGLGSEIATVPVPVAVTGSTDVSRVGDGSDPQPQRTLLWRPRVKVRWNNGRLIITRTDRHSRGYLVVQAGKAAAPIRARSRSRRASFRLSKKPKRVRLWVVSKAGTWRSLSVGSRVP